MQGGVGWAIDDGQSCPKRVGTYTPLRELEWSFLTSIDLLHANVLSEEQTSSPTFSTRAIVVNKIVSFRWNELKFCRGVIRGEPGLSKSEQVSTRRMDVIQMISRLWFGRANIDWAQHQRLRCGVLNGSWQWRTVDDNEIDCAVPARSVKMKNMSRGKICIFPSSSLFLFRAMAGDCSFRAPGSLPHPTHVEIGCCFLEPDRQPRWVGLALDMASRSKYATKLVWVASTKLMARELPMLVLNRWVP